MKKNLFITWLVLSAIGLGWVSSRYHYAPKATKERQEAFIQGFEAGRTGDCEVIYEYSVMLWKEICQ